MSKGRAYAWLLLAVVGISACCNGAADKRTSFKVWGNCGMCKKTIEGAADDAGVCKASWNKSTKQLDVVYDTTKTSITAIQQSIAKAGYDTEPFSGNDEAYKNLPDCCQYERKSANTK